MTSGLQRKRKQKRHSFHHWRRQAVEVKGKGLGARNCGRKSTMGSRGGDAPVGKLNYNIKFMLLKIRSIVYTTSVVSVWDTMQSGTTPMTAFRTYYIYAHLRIKSCDGWGQLPSRWQGAVLAQKFWGGGHCPICPFVTESIVSVLRNWKKYEQNYGPTFEIYH